MNNEINKLNVENEEVITEKASGSTSCSASCFWSSCSATCPANLGVAVCGCVSIWGGLLGSSAVCSCGGAGQASKLSFNDDQIDRFNILILITSDPNFNSDRVTALKDAAMDIVKHNSNNGNSWGKNRKLMIEFFDAANNLEVQEAKHIAVELRNYPECSSLDPISDCNY